MASNPSAACPRKTEVTRTVHLDPVPDLGTPSPSTITPRYTQHVVWAGPTHELLGYSLRSIDSTEAWWSESIHPEDVTRVSRSLRDHLVPAPDNPYAAPSRIWSADYRLRHADGSFVLVSDQTTTSRSADGVAKSFRSVILHKEQHKRQREMYERRLITENHLAIIANNTPSGIFMMDPHGYATYMNAAAEKITGFTFQEIYSLTFHASVHSCRRNGDDYPLHECPVVTTQQRGIAAKNQSEVFVHKDGHFYDIVWSISPIGNYASGGYVIEFRDVTEEKLIEQERLQAMLVNEQQSVRLKESEIHKKNMTSFVSFVCHEVRNPLQGITSSSLFLSSTLDKLSALAKTLKVSKPDSEIEIESPLNSSQFSEDRTADDRRIVHGRPQQMIQVDATNLDSIESLIAYASELVANIQTCAEHQALITDNVLDLSRLDAGKVEPLLEVVDVQALGQQTIDMMAAKAHRKQISLSMKRLNEPPLYLKADGTLLKQVMLNLISNAIKFTPDNGKITLDLHVERAPGDSEKLVLHGAVEDNGLGMTEAEQDRLFKRFSQANQRVAQLYGGSGLGLSISKELVKVMGGQMSVASELGKGSTFSFTSSHDATADDELFKLLRIDNPANDVLRPSNNGVVDFSSSSQPPKFKVIGVAEDNPINLKHLAKSLELLGYQTILCTNGQEILDAFCERASMLDAIVLDMSMPVLGGLEAVRRMRDFEAPNGAGPRERMPIIALSGNAMKEQISGALAAGVSDYLTKPCRQADLARTLEHWERIVHAGAEHRPLQRGTR